MYRNKALLSLIFVNNIILTVHIIVNQSIFIVKDKIVKVKSWILPSVKYNILKKNI